MEISAHHHPENWMVSPLVCAGQTSSYKLYITHGNNIVIVKQKKWKKAKYELIRNIAFFKITENKICFPSGNCQYMKLEMLAVANPGEGPAPPIFSH